ncbi:hypothetical protein SPRG_09843 [Saprolegnia parasitica CBS 223.65]|uniref:Uncharacterized protein n=1 Tax=Saprolegnia parasitica (strain CBS 223.65) TaxID=695850 RepID=A0A067C1N5_SAPPC|nr:hypothetical protein SPRG_09843 [Saprolegnia parasitica CBS 223.65]KDO24453.1 hypothetical protein SPRG_09843 [Saprolegnia parasitica CBS 223.65]|eukprot:XP_012204882.1 hypothetical protein SPRG_09843 [Saprolegnia parasitica CBS 223.65]
MQEQLEAVEKAGRDKAAATARAAQDRRNEIAALHRSRDQDVQAARSAGDLVGAKQSVLPVMMAPPTSLFLSTHAPRLARTTIPTPTSFLPLLRRLPRASSLLLVLSVSDVVVVLVLLVAVVLSVVVAVLAAVLPTAQHTVVADDDDRLGGPVTPVSAADSTRRSAITDASAAQFSCALWDVFVDVRQDYLILPDVVSAPVLCLRSIKKHQKLAKSIWVDHGQAMLERILFIESPEVLARKAALEAVIAHLLIDLQGLRMKKFVPANTHKFLAYPPSDFLA